jgi:hypothetical protein
MKGGLWRFGSAMLLPATEKVRKTSGQTRFGAAAKQARAPAHAVIFQPGG